MTRESGGFTPDTMERVSDWLNAFKADPFSTGADKSEGLLRLIRDQQSRLVRQAIDIVENGSVEIATGLGTFTAEERDIILRALQTKSGGEA